MRPKASKKTQEQPLIGWRLDMVLDADQDLYRLAGVIDWAGMEAVFGRLYVPDLGRPGIRARLMAGLVLLQHTLGLSDEEVVKRWPENPCWRFHRPHRPGIPLDT